MLRRLLLALVATTALVACSSDPAPSSPVSSSSREDDRGDEEAADDEQDVAAHTPLFDVLPMQDELPGGWAEDGAQSAESYAEDPWVEDESFVGDFLEGDDACRRWWDGDYGALPTDWAEVYFSRGDADALTIWVGEFDGVDAVAEVPALREVVSGCRSYSYDEAGDVATEHLRVLPDAALGDDRFTWSTRYLTPAAGWSSHDVTVAVRVGTLVAWVTVATSGPTDAAEVGEIAAVVADRLGGFAEAV